MFKYKYNTYAFVSIVFFILIILIIFFKEIDVEIIICYFLLYFYLLSLINNSWVTLFKSISVDSTEGEILARGYLISIIFLTLLGFMFSYLFN